MKILYNLFFDVKGMMGMLLDRFHNSWLELAQRFLLWPFILINNVFVKPFAIKFILCFLVIISQWSILYSNDSDSIKKPFILGIGPHYGFIIPHSEDIRSISKSKPRGLEVDICWLMTGEKTWDYCFCYPRGGISLLIIDYDNKEIIGNAVSCAAYIEPFITYTKRLNLSYRASLGLACLDNPYDSISNPQNLFYSTNLGFIASLCISLNFKINERVNLKIKGNYNHISNGGFKRPNKGINFPTAGCGFDYTFNPVKLAHYNNIGKKQLYSKKLKFNFITLYSAKTVDRMEDKKYLIYGFSIEMSKLVGRVSRLSVGTEWISDLSIKEELKRKQIALNHQRASVLAGHELLIGRFSFSQQLGVYYYQPVKAMDNVYQRWGLKFGLSDNLFIGVNLKAHRHVADFMDFRIGYSL